MKDKQDINQLKEKFFKAGGIVKKLPFIPSYYPSKKIRWHYADKPSMPEWLNYREKVANRMLKTK